MCEYCKGKEFNKPIYDDGVTRMFIEDGTNNFLIDDEFRTEISIIKYCPMCGRKLEATNATAP